MYHERSYEDRLLRKVGIIFAAMLLFALIMFGLFFYSLVQDSLEERAAESIRASILNTAMQCCAVEGSYPMTLSYMEENYGLRVNDEDFLITYEAFASNVLPTVTVVPR